MARPTSSGIPSNRRAAASTPFRTSSKTLPYVFSDSNQNIYRRALSFPSGLVEIPLTENLRNTRAIHELAACFYSNGSFADG